jgi:HlyD family secretion protein
MKTKTWLILAGIATVVVVIVVASGGLGSGTPVEVTEVRSGPIEEFVDERGKTRLPETYLITMPITGRIEPITLTEGDPVEEGKPVARIVPDDLQLAVEGADAAVKRLEASVAENLDANLEKITLRQAAEFVQSMRDTVEAAAKQVESARVKLDYSTTNLARMERLQASGAATEDELDLAKLRKAEDALALDQNELIHRGMLALQKATELVPELVTQFIQDKQLTDAVLEWQQAEATVRLEQAKLDQQRGTMTSPVSGTVLKRCVCNERYLPPGTELMEIGRLEDLEVEADVLSVDVADVKKGAVVKIYGPAIGKGLPGDRDYAKGMVDKVYPAGFTKISSLGVEQQRVKVIIRFAPEDLQRLRAERGLGVGYRVRARITTDQKPTALVIPRSALFRDAAGRWNVYAIRGGRARFQEVEIGILNDERAEVTAGLAAGDLVVRAPESDLENGQRVKVLLEGDS